MAGVSTFQAIVARVAALEQTRSGAEGAVVALTQSLGFLLGVLATRPEAGDVINVMRDHYFREHDRLKTSGKFSETFLTEYMFTVETITGTATGFATAFQRAMSQAPRPETDKDGEASDGC